MKTNTSKFFFIYSKTSYFINPYNISIIKKRPKYGSYSLENPRDPLVYMEVINSTTPFDYIIVI